MEAMFGFDDFQASPARLPPVLPSLNVPVALNLIEVRTAILGFGGVMLMPTRWAVDTVRSVEPLTVPKAAAIVVLPVARLVATPVLAIVAAAGFEELQTTDPEMSCVLLSLKVPVATNCFEAPIGMVEFAGVTAIETRLAPVTVIAALPVIDPTVAFTLPVPPATPAASPEESTVTTPGAEDDQLTEVKVCVLPSSKIPVAANC